MIKKQCFLYYNETDEELEDFVDKVYQLIDYNEVSIIIFNGKPCIFNPHFSKHELIENLI